MDQNKFKYGTSLRNFEMWLKSTIFEDTNVSETLERHMKDKIDISDMSNLKDIRDL